MTIPSRILITGASGFIGRALCQRLHAQHHVIALARPGSRRLELLRALPGIQIVCGDLDNIIAIINQLGHIDAVVHLGWRGMSKEDQICKKIQGQDLTNSLSLVDSAISAGCKVFVGGGSQAEYGPIDSLVNEKAVCNPITEYGKAKLRFTLDGAKRSFQAGMSFRVARIFSVYGPHDHPWTLISSLLNALKKGELIPLSNCKHLWNYLFVDDAANALASLLEADCEDGIYNVASRITAPLKDFVHQIFALYSNDVPPRFCHLSPSVVSSVSINPCIEKLLANTGWVEKVDFSQGIQRTWEHLK